MTSQNEVRGGRVHDANATLRTLLEHERDRMHQEYRQHKRDIVFHERAAAFALDMANACQREIDAIREATACERAHSKEGP